VPQRTNGVLLVVEDPRAIGYLVDELRTLGCPIILARDLDQASELVRGVPAMKILLVHVRGDRMSIADPTAATAGGEEPLN
jgi:hypothetical protein